jgi:serine/threonine protein kinase/Tol biopolymer transport system component
MSLNPGTRLGRYEIKSLIGAGGMGEVYLAHDAKLDRTVALKVLPAEVAADQKRMSRFVQEARAASALNHPHIITIYEIEDEAQPPYIATEFIDGETLRASVARGGLRLADALEIVAQIASALSAAHAAGIVHRDIKPENVMLRRDGYVKVLDFGLAKLTEHKASAVDTEAATRALVVTDPGAVMGTVGYMSPEQARGLETDARTDLWSVGVVLYELMTGRLPFAGATPTDTILAIVDKEPPPLSAYAPAAPDALEWIVTKALTKEREDRYQTAREMLNDLRRLKQRLDVNAEMERSVAPPLSSAPPASTAGHETQTLAQSPPVHTTEVGAASTISSSEFFAAKLKGHKRGFLVTVALILVALAGLGFGLYKFLGRRQASAGSPVAPLQSMRFSKLPASGETIYDAISPDGKLIARAVGEGGKQGLRLRQVASGASEREIVPPADVKYYGVSFAPDASSVYYVTLPAGNTACTLYRVPVIGGDPQKLVFDVDSAVTFSPDGKRMAFKRHAIKTNEDTLVITDADGGGEQTILRQAAPVSRFNNPAWSPDGRVIAYTVYDKDDEGGYGTIETVNVADRTTKPLSSARWHFLSSIAWMSGGSGLIVSGVPRAAPPNTRNQLWHVSYPDGEPYQITNDPSGYSSLSLAADSRTLLSRQTTLYSNIWVVPGEDPSRASQITNSTARIDEFDWMPDGRIVYSSQASGNDDIWVMNADGSGNRQLTLNPENDRMPTVSPDGRYIVFQSVRAGVHNLYRMNADGTGTKELVHNIDQQVFPQISHDSQWVYYTPTDRSTGKIVLLKVSIDGGESVKLHEGTFFHRLSPDGQYFLAWVQTQQQNEPLMMIVFPAAGGDAVRTLKAPPDINLMAWSPDARAVDFPATRAGVTNVWRLPLDGGAEKQITTWKTDAPLYWLGWSRDGKNLAVVRDNSTTDLVLIQNFR